MPDQGNQANKSMHLPILTILFLCGVSAGNVVLAPTIHLSNGYYIPVVGLGTAGTDNSEQAVKDAIDCGYRHIDTAYSYGNEVDVGKAVNAKIDEGVIKREDIFITTKLTSTFHDQVERAFNKSLENLNITYVDLYLIHSPLAFLRFKKDGTKADEESSVDDILLHPFGEDVYSDVDYIDTWKAMEKLVKSGRVRSIGVSNFNSEQVDRVLAAAEIKPVINQIECHPNLNQRKFLKFLADRNILLVAYSPLGAGQNLAINHHTVLELAEKHNKTPAQIVLRYTYQNGAVVIPKSSHKERIQSNINIFHFSLNDEEMETIHGLNTITRLLQLSDARGNKYYPFDLEF